MTEIRERLARLVAFPSVSGSDMGAMLDWLTAEVAPYASLCQRLPATAHCAEALLVRIGEGEDGLVLAGHLDVVPVAGQPWTGEPFTLREADGRYYGRGVCDMKSFFACALALLPQLPPLRAPLWLAISCDEEIGCLSAPRLARALRGRRLRLGWRTDAATTGRRAKRYHQPAYHRAWPRRAQQPGGAGRFCHSCGGAPCRGH